MNNENAPIHAWFGLSYAKYLVLLLYILSENKAFNFFWQRVHLCGD